MYNGIHDHKAMNLSPISSGEGDKDPANNSIILHLKAFLVSKYLLLLSYLYL